MKHCKEWDKLPYQLVQDFFRQQYYSNHPFSGAMLVSGSVQICITFSGNPHYLGSGSRGASDFCGSLKGGETETTSSSIEMFVDLSRKLPVFFRFGRILTYPQMCVYLYRRVLLWVYVVD